VDVIIPFRLYPVLKILSIKNVLSEVASVIEILIWSIASLLELVTEEISSVMFWNTSGVVIDGVFSIQLPPASWKPSLIFEPVREERISYFISFRLDRFIGDAIVRVRDWFSVRSSLAKALIE